MLDGIPVAEISGPAALCLVALLVITDRLVWHTRLKAEIQAREQWQETALRALGVADKMTVHGEAAVEVISAIPAVPERTADGGGHG